MKHAIATLAISLFLACPAARAAIYKCVDASGKATFQQQPCPQASSGGQLSLREGDWVRVDSHDMPNTMGTFVVETDLDAARIKKTEKGVLALFRQTLVNRHSDYPPTSNLVYALYLCGEGRVAGPDSDAKTLEHRCPTRTRPIAPRTPISRSASPT